MSLLNMYNRSEERYKRYHSFKVSEVNQLNQFLRGFFKTIIWTSILTIAPIMLLTLAGDIYEYIVNNNTQFNGLFWAYPLSLMALLFTLPFALLVFIVNWFADRKKQHT